MNRLDVRQMIALTLAILLARPVTLPAEGASDEGAKAMIGSLSTRGSVNVGKVAAPAESTLFAGDEIRTEEGSAVIQYAGGAVAELAMNSAVSVSADRVELRQGQMDFRASANGPAFAATSLRLEPETTGTAASVIFKDNRAGVSVSEGSVKVVDPSGEVLETLKAGETRLYARAMPTATAAAAPGMAAAAPQMDDDDDDDKKVWLIVLGGTAALATFGITKAVNNGNQAPRPAVSEVVP